MERIISLHKHNEKIVISKLHLQSIRHEVPLTYTIGFTDSSKSNIIIKRQTIDIDNANDFEEFRG